MHNPWEFLTRLKFRKWFVLGLITLIATLLLSGSADLTPAAIAQPPVNPLAQVQIDPETVVGQPGFFRVGQSTRDRWWLIDPEGQPFFFKGVTSIGTGRDVPPADNYPGYIEPYPGYSEIITQKYGSDAAAFRDATYERLRRWNFNALGAWSAGDLTDQDFPYTVVLDFVRVGPTIESPWVKVPDVFALEWRQAIDAQAQKFVATRRNDPMLVGYFTDNELGWGDLEKPDHLPRLNPDLLLTSDFKPSLLQVCLSLKPEQPAYQAAWRFVLARHGEHLVGLAKAWQVDIETPEQIQQWTQTGQALVSRGYLADQRAFVTEFAQRYFEQTAAAIHRYDDHHLILGCRFGSPPSAALFTALKRPWVDVVSANNYRYAMYERMDQYYQATHLPILNGEFSWGHSVFAERPLPDEPEGGLPATERMVRNGEQALTRAWTHPALVGYTWYRWVDQPTGQPPYIPPISLGLVTLADEPNHWHTDLLTQLNAQAEAIAAGIESELP
ncbi:MAG: hypothetical protein F6J87_14185 [Spirulina sp. SIO3F2]|nr:hypothetical protein [Spirulina sp. SIO3F2]